MCSHLTRVQKLNVLNKCILRDKGHFCLSGYIPNMNLIQLQSNLGVSETLKKYSSKTLSAILEHDKSVQW